MCPTFLPCACSSILNKGLPDEFLQNLRQISWYKQRSKCISAFVLEFAKHLVLCGSRRSANYAAAMMQATTQWFPVRIARNFETLNALHLKMIVWHSLSCTLHKSTAIHTCRKSRVFYSSQYLRHFLPISPTSATLHDALGPARSFPGQSRPLAVSASTRLRRRSCSDGARPDHARVGGYDSAGSPVSAGTTASGRPCRRVRQRRVAGVGGYDSAGSPVSAGTTAPGRPCRRVRQRRVARVGGYDSAGSPVSAGTTAPGRPCRRVRHRRVARVGGYDIAGSPVSAGMTSPGRPCRRV